MILLNAVFAFVQELQAEQRREALRRVPAAEPACARRRPGRDRPARDLVPGDVLLIAEGDRLSADARLVGGAVEVDMSPLTGESQPVDPRGRAAHRSRARRSRPTTSSSRHAVHRRRGQRRRLRDRHGDELGRIAALSQRVEPELSPLQRRCNRAAWLIAAIAVAVGVVFLVARHRGGRPAACGAAVSFAIGLLVANVPEGLLPTITLALAVGVRRMARTRRAGQAADRGRDARLDRRHLHRQDRHAHRGPDARQLPVARGAELVAPADVEAGAAARAALRAAAHRGALQQRPAADDGDGWRRGGDPDRERAAARGAELGVDVDAAQRGRDRRAPPCSTSTRT